MGKCEIISGFYVDEMDTHLQEVVKFDLSNMLYKDIHFVETAIVLFLWKYLTCEKIITEINDKFFEIKVDDMICCQDIYLSLSTVGRNGENLECDSMQFVRLRRRKNKELYVETNIRKLTCIKEKALVEILETVMLQLLNSRNIISGDVVFISENKYYQIVESYNKTEVKYDKETLLHDMFEYQVNIHPDFIAVTDGKNEISYKQLDELSNGIAQKLMELDVCKGDYIAIAMMRSITMIASIIAVLKIGCTYIPINPSTPEERVLVILKSSGCNTMIMDMSNQNKYNSMVEEQNKKSLVITEESIDVCKNKGINYISISQLFKLADKYSAHTYAKSSDLAYVIYTSGTTGTPKGVKIKHSSVVNVIEWMNRTFSINFSDKLLFITSISFDLSVYDIFGILASGGMIRLATDEELGNPLALLKIICNENITIWDSAPPALQQIMLYAEELSLSDFKYNKIRWFFLSGDWIPVQLPNKLKYYFTDANVISLGGATEATIWSNYYFIQKINPQWKSIPYGRPIQNAKYYILDKNYNPLPEYFEGEIFIGGECLSSGYLGDEELTSQKFVSNPFNSKEKVYATGDLGRWMYDGNIELLGRIDNQVKVRGYRIELDEIKSLIEQLEYVEEAVVTAYGEESHEKCIYAFVLLKEDVQFKNNSFLLDGWKNVFEYNYDSQNEDLQNDFVGWNDSISGKQINEEEMKEWLKDTLDVIKLYHPQNVLEVGCGTGMIMFGLLPEIESYEGSDISENALLYINSKIKNEGYNAENVKLSCNAADNFEAYDNRRYDTIILNSVVQYFPDFDYFENVIKKAIKQIKSTGGHIFIGDVKNYDYIKEFSGAMNDKDEEKELFISPMQFYLLQMKYSEIAYVEVLLKNGLYNNELSKYRYDVVLHIKEKLDFFECSELNYINWEKIKSSIFQNMNNSLVIEHVPLEQLQGENRNSNNTLLEKILSMKQECTVKCIYTPEEQDCTILILKEKSDKVLQVYGDTFLEEFIPKLQVVNLINTPFYNLRKYKLEENIRKSLLRVLPSYMVPSCIDIVKSIPLTANGKIDIKQLISNSRNNVVKEKVEPSSNIEKKVLAIFSKILGGYDFGITSKFSELGGHSIKATLICLEIERELNVRISVKDILEHQTVQEISAIVSEKESENYRAIERRTLKEAPATSNQRRMYIAQNLVKANIIYNVVDINKVVGAFANDRFITALNTAMEKISALKTTFFEIGGELWQKINDSVRLNYELINIKDVKELQILIKKKNEEFDLERAPLWKTIVCNLNEKENYVIFIFHHSIMDGISLGIFKRILESCYGGVEYQGETIDFLDYAIWEKEKINDVNFVTKRNYWRNRLEGISNISYLEPDYNRPIRKNYSGINKFFDFPRKTLEKLYEVANNMNTTPFTILIANYFLFLHKQTGNEDIIIGSVAANRTHPDLVSLIGMLVNTIPLRMKIDGETTAEEFISGVEKSIRSDLENQDFPYEVMCDECISNDTSEIFSAVIAYQNISNLPLRLGSSISEHINYENNISKFDISFIFNEKGSDLELEVEYSTELYSDQSVLKFVERFYFLLDNMLNHLSIKIKDLTLEPKENIVKIYKKLNDTSYQFNDTKTYIDRFLSVCAEKGNKIALVDGNRSISYHMLLKRIEEIVVYINSLDLPRNSIIAIFAKTSIDTIASQLAILMCGHAFLCMDINHPIDRNAYILSDSNAKLLLYCAEKPEFNKKDIIMQNISDIPLKSGEAMENVSSLCKQNTSYEIAYIIYTSGSTGQPKGVAISYHSLLNLCIWHNDYYNVTENDAATRYAGAAFDAAVWELFPYLIVGAAVHIIPEKIKLEIEGLNKYFENENITITFLPTQFAEEFMKIENRSLRCLLTGGDVLKNYCCTRYKVFNNYGPTENTVVTTVYEVQEKNNRIPIGKPIYNNEVYILDKYNNLLPDNVPGELAIAGDGLAIGYVDSSLDSSRFVKLDKKRVYLTGDIVMLNSDGMIEYLHRKDFQVQIRGYRIELGEIEYNIDSYVEIDNCVVVSKKSGSENVLICFYTAKNEIDVNLLKEYLYKRIPPYMIPAYYIFKEELPLMASGKVDRNKLIKDLTVTVKKTKENVRKVKSDEEMIIAEIWKALFDVEDVYGDTDFYELGGDSIRAVQFISKLRSYGYALEVSDVYENPVVENLAKKLNKDMCSKRENKITGNVELFAIQKWYLSKVRKGTEYFNMSEFVQFPDTINMDIFNQAIRAILEYHDSLRSTFLLSDGTWRLEIGDDINQYYDIEEFFVENKTEVVAKAQKVQEKLSVASKLTMSIGIFYIKTEVHILFCVKHLVIDAYSFTILLQDIFSVYDAMINEKKVNLPSKTHSVAEWIDGINKNKIDVARNYWLYETQKFFDKNEKKYNFNYKINDYHLTIDGELVEKIKKLGGKGKHNIETVLLCSLIRSVCELFGEKKVVINVEKHGRDNGIIGLDISRTTGWFTNKYPIEFLFCKDIESNINHVALKMKESKQFGVFYDVFGFEDNYESYKYFEPQISFNYLGYYQHNQYADFIEYSDLPKGEIFSKDSQRFYALDINIKMFDEKVCIDYSFDENRYSYKTIESLSKKMVYQIGCLTNNCHKKTRKENEKKERIMLHNIKPFTEVFYKDCYIQALIPVIGFFVVVLRTLLANDIFLYEKIDNPIFPIKVKNVHLMSDENILRALNIDCYKMLKSENVCKDIKNALRSNHPVIINIDCFYLPMRLDMYQKTHLPHVLLVVGFDDLNKNFWVIEHDNLNSINFRKKEVSYGDLEMAYKGGIEFFDNDYIITYYEFYSRKGLEKIDIDPTKTFFENFNCNIENMMKGINELKSIINREFLFEVNTISRTDIGNVILLINNIINYKKAAGYAISVLLDKNYELVNTYKCIIEQWELVRKYFFGVKYMETYDEIDFSELKKSLSEIIELEEKIISEISTLSIENGEKNRY